MPKYKALNTFKEVDHDGTVYEAGDPYPKEGFKAEKKRVAFLQDLHPEYGVRFLTSEDDGEQGEENNDDSDLDKDLKHVGGGWYLLPNGEKVQGKDEAVEALAGLNKGAEE